MTFDLLDEVNRENGIELLGERQYRALRLLKQMCEQSGEVDFFVSRDRDHSTLQYLPFAGNNDFASSTSVIQIEFPQKTALDDYKEFLEKLPEGRERVQSDITWRLLQDLQRILGA